MLGKLEWRFRKRLFHRARQPAHQLRWSVMKRTIAVLALAAAVALACKKKEEPAPAAPPPATTSSVATTTTAVPAPGIVPDVSASNAPVPTSGLELWLRGDYGVTADAAGKVTSWAVEGSSLKAGAKDPAEWPSLVAAAINGKPAMRFDGDHNMLEVPMSIDAVASPELTVISVWSSATADKTTLRKLYGADDGGYDRAAGIDTRASDASNYTVFAGSGGVVGVFTFTANTPNITIENYANKKLNTWVNGAVARANIDAEYGQMPDHFFIGGTGHSYTEPWQGDLAEMLVYKRTLTDEERKKVEDYLGGRYGIKLTRP
jgi:hypothetical protein